MMVSDPLDEAVPLNKQTNKQIYWDGRRQQERARLLAIWRAKPQSPEQTPEARKCIISLLQETYFSAWAHIPTSHEMAVFECPTHWAPHEVSKLRYLSEILNEINKTPKSRAKPTFVHCVSPRLAWVTVISWPGFHLEVFLCMELILILGYFPGTSLIRRM